MRQTDCAAIGSTPARPTRIRDRVRSVLTAIGRAVASHNADAIAGPLQYDWRVHINAGLPNWSSSRVPPSASAERGRPGVVRVWRGRTQASRADAYLEYLRATGLPAYRRTGGNRAVQVHRRVRDEVAEFFVLSWWDDMNAVREFAKGQVDDAVYYPDDRDFLLEMDPRVRHFELVYDSTAE